MSQEVQFLIEDEDGIEEYRISTVSGIKSPNFIPEIKSAEDLHAILPHLDALEDNNPVMVPGHRFDQIRTQPQFSKYGPLMRRFMGLPQIYYEPPEYFRYKMADALVSYALKGSISKRREFNDLVKEGRLDKAIEELPLFFQPFLDRQRKTLLRSDDDYPDHQTEENEKLVDAWGDPRADRGYKSYFRGIVQNAKQAENAHVAPPVPVIRKSSDGTSIRRMRGANRAMATICDATHWSFDNPVFSYYHIYADTNIIRESGENAQRIIDALQLDLGDQDHRYGGVILTLTGYEKAWNSNYSEHLTDFVGRVADLSKRHYKPLILPRSKWAGEYLTDFGANGFGSLLNGGERYTGGGGMSKDNRHYRYGKIPLYDHATELYIDQFETHFQNNGGQVHRIQGLPDRPSIYNSNGDNFKEKFDTAPSFRKEFGKPRRLLHAQEARELQDGLRQGLAKPASRYLERSNHPFLS